MRHWHCLAVMEDLNTKLLSLADCDADLLSVQVFEMPVAPSPQEELGAGGIVNGIDALAQAEAASGPGLVSWSR